MAGEANAICYLEENLVHVTTIGWWTRTGRIIGLLVMASSHWKHRANNVCSMGQLNFLLTDKKHYSNKIRSLDQKNWCTDQKTA